jgi:hypothetical protein
LHVDTLNEEVRGAIAIATFNNADLSTELLHGVESVQTVFTAQEVLNFSGSLGETAEDSDAVGDTFVSRYQ